MVVKIIWALIGMNSIALLFFIGLSIAGSQGRNVDYMEKGWTIILVILGLIVILLAAIPLRFSHSTFSIFFSGFFAILPLLIFSINFISKKIPSSRKSETLAEFYYGNKTQRRIAAAIEQNDTALLGKLIKGADLNIQGNRVWSQDGISYLQFAVRLRSDSGSFPFVDEINKSIIRLLVAHGAATTPALGEAIHCLPPDIIGLLLDNGANPNTHGFVSSNPLLFEAIGTKKEKNSTAILLIQRGADVNAKNDYEQTPLMSAATNSGTSAQWTDCWRVVLYMLEQAHADYSYTRSDGINFAGIIKNIRTEAATKQITMPSDFLAVVEWLKKHHVDTEVVKSKI